MKHAGQGELRYVPRGDKLKSSGDHFHTWAVAARAAGKTFLSAQAAADRVLALALERADLTVKRALALAEYALVAAGSPVYSPPADAPAPAPGSAPATGLAMLQQAAAIAGGASRALVHRLRGIYESGQAVKEAIAERRIAQAAQVAAAMTQHHMALGLSQQWMFGNLGSDELIAAAPGAILLHDFSGGVIDVLTHGIWAGAFGSDQNSTAYTVGVYAGVAGLVIGSFVLASACVWGPVMTVLGVGMAIHTGVGMLIAGRNIINGNAGVGDYLAFLPLVSRALGKAFQFCFEAGTQVIVGVDENGEAITRNIEDIREGDYVLAGDENDPSTPPTLRRVTQVFIKTTHELRVLSFVGADGSTTTLNTTDEHPFFVFNQGWVRADQLQIGDTLVQPDGSFVTLAASQIEARSQGVTVYNLEVDGGHTYFVDDGVAGGAVWVHNANYLKGVVGVTGKRVANVRQLHHAIPWNHSTYRHGAHALVKQAKIDLATYSKNMKSLLGHAGRHSNAYHTAIATRMSSAYAKVAGKGQAAAKKALDGVIKGIWRDIKSGKLTPYNTKDVI